MHTKCWNLLVRYGVEFKISQAGGELVDVTSNTGENAVVNPYLAARGLLGPATQAEQQVQGGPQVVLTLNNTNSPDYAVNELEFRKPIYILSKPSLLTRFQY